MDDELIKIDNSDVGAITHVTLSDIVGVEIRKRWSSNTGDHFAYLILGQSGRNYTCDKATYSAVLKKLEKRFERRTYCHVGPR